MSNGEIVTFKIQNPEPTGVYLDFNHVDEIINKFDLTLAKEYAESGNVMAKAIVAAYEQGMKDAVNKRDLEE